MSESQWRVISNEVHDAAFNMALDESAVEHISAGKSPPTIRFYRWQPSAVSIGRFQSMKREINVLVCESLGIDTVRRITGGGAVYHDCDGEITYSVISPEHLMPEGITESYHLICSWIVDALGIIGIESGFKPINDIITNGKKISGNAQTRRKGVLLQHGTILLTVDVDKMFSLLNVPDEKIRDKMIATVKERVTCIKDQKQVSRASVEEALLKAFTRHKGWFFGSWSRSELDRAAELKQQRYANKQWNFSR